MLWQRNLRCSFIGAAIVVACAVLGAGQRSSAALVNLTPTVGANSADSVSLGDLVTGDVMGLIVGDKIFTGFSYSPIGDVPPADQINVLGFRDPSGNWGISFHGAFFDLPGGGASDALIRYMVEVDPEFLQRGFRISDAHLFIGGVGAGSDGDVGAGPGSFVSVDESFLESDEQMSAIFSTLGPGNSQLSDWVYFTPVLPKLNVVKDILLFAADNSSEPARVTVIDQSFSQTFVIPEPASIGLVLIGAVAVGGLTRRRKRNA
jgi:hypothetical protein